MVQMMETAPVLRSAAASAPPGDFEIPHVTTAKGHRIR
jgi:hypothetical protein